jgi:hypothetical protein
VSGRRRCDRHVYLPRGEKKDTRVSLADERAHTFLDADEKNVHVIGSPLYEKEHDPKKHEKHLCRLVEAGTTLSEYSRLAFKGNYLCKQCGRVANAEECLCEPVDMRQIRF